MQTKVIVWGLSAALLIVGCSKKSSDGGSSGATSAGGETGDGSGGDDENSGTTTVSSTDTGTGSNTSTGTGTGTNTNTNTNTATNTNTGGAGNVLLDTAGFGRGDTVIAGNPVGNQLLAVTPGGEIQPVQIGQVGIETTGLMLDDAAEIDEETLCVQSIGSNMTVVAARVRSTGTPLFAGSKTELALLLPEGVLRPLFPAESSGVTELKAGTKCTTEIQAPSSGSVYVQVKNGTAIWKFDAETGEGSPLVTAPANGSIESFLSLSGGDVIYQTNVLGTKSVTWRKPTGAVSDLGYPNNVIDNPITLGASGVTFIGNQYAGGQVLTVSGGQLLRYFVEPFSIFADNASTMRTWGAPTGVRVGDWVVDARSAIEYGSGKVAGNALWRGQYRNQGIVDWDQQLYFDGSNIVKIVDDGGTAKIVHHLNLVQRAEEPYKLLGVYGPAQGFDDWVGVATDDRFGSFDIKRRTYWVTIDKTTGLVDLDAPLLIRAPNMPSYWQNNAAYGPDVAPEFVPFRVALTGGGHKIVGMSSASGANLVELTFDSGAGTVTMEAELTGAYTRNYTRAIVQGPKIFFTPSYFSGAGDATRVYFYDGDSNTLSDATSSIAPAAGLTDLSAGGCNGTKLLGLIRQPDHDRPTLIYCDTNFKVRASEFTDYTFSATTVTTDSVVWPLDVPQTSDDEGDFTVGTQDSVAQLQIAPLGGGRHVMGSGRRQWARVVEATGATLSETAFADLKMEGRFEYSRAFIDTADAYVNETRLEPGHVMPAPIVGPGVPTDRQLYPTRTVAPWDTTRFFASSMATSGEQASYVFDIGARSRTALSALEDLEAHAVVRLGSGSLLVSVSADGDPATKKAKTLDNAGVESESTDESSVLREVVQTPQE